MTDKITESVIDALSPEDHQTFDYILMMCRLGKPESELLSMLLMAGANAEAMRRVRFGEQGRTMEQVFDEKRLATIRLSLSVLNEVFGEPGV